MRFDKLTKDNVLMFAIQNYDNPQAEGEKEFYDDILYDIPNSTMFYDKRYRSIFDVYFLRILLGGRQYGQH